MSTSPTAAERRPVIVAGLLFFGALLLLIVIAIVFAGDAGDERTTASTIACEADDAACIAAARSGEGAGIIPTPGSGRAPTQSGDPGGSGQILVFVGLVTALAVIITVVVRSTRRTGSARRTRPPS